MSRLVGKIAIVTGSNSVIGKAIAPRFAEEGAKVGIAGRRKSLWDETAEPISAKGGQAVAVRADVSMKADVEALFTTAVHHFGRVDIAVNNAGVFGSRRIEETTTKAYDEVMNVNLRGTFFWQSGAKHMKSHGGEVIINVSSVADCKHGPAQASIAPRSTA